MTQAVAELSTQAQGGGRTPRRRVVHWRYGMGFVLLIASILSLVLVGQIAGWIQNPHDSARAAAAADFRASALQTALRGLPEPPTGVPEAAYADAVREVQGVLLDVDYPSAPDTLPTGFTVRLYGSVTSGVLSGHHTTVVFSCFHFVWTSSPAAAERRVVACPVPAIRPDVTRAGASDEDATGSGAALVGLATRLTGLDPAQRAVSADAGGTRRLLGAAGAVPGVPWEAEYPWRTDPPPGGRAQDTALAIGTGGSAGCLFVDLHGGTLTAWVAPQSAPCTAARAARAALVYGT